MRKISFSISFLLLFSISSFAGGPWAQAKGKGYFKLSEWWVIFDQHYTDAGLIDPNTTTGVFNSFLYAEYGLTNRLTVIVNAPLFSRNYMNNIVSVTTGEIVTPGESLNSIGDIEMGLKYGLTAASAKIPIALSMRFGIPTGKTGGTQNNLQTGDGEFNQIIQLDAGKGFSLKKTPAYISTYIGLNNRSKGYSEELRLGLETGFGLIGQKLWLVGKLDIVESFKNGETAATITSTSIFANNTEYSSFSFEANYYITDKIGISASIASAFRGEIIAAASSYSVGVFYDMK